MRKDEFKNLTDVSQAHLRYYDRIYLTRWLILNFPQVFEEATHLPGNSITSLCLYIKHTFYILYIGNKTFHFFQINKAYDSSETKRVSLVNILEDTAVPKELKSQLLFNLEFFQ